LELAIPVPDVRLWSGEEAQAVNKLGWASTQHEVNVTILNQGCKQIALTAAHEVKHCEQFMRFPNLTPQQRESDARQFEKEFGLHVWEKDNWS
jgi:hypothetical protein